jgi:hypothetical protein
MGCRRRGFIAQHIGKRTLRAHVVQLSSFKLVFGLNG